MTTPAEGLTTEAIFEASEVIARGNACPICLQPWVTASPTERVLTHSADCRLLQARTTADLLLQANDED